ncbi:hypothetical protein Tco_0674493 [Tanacetum coccineum]
MTDIIGDKFQPKMMCPGCLGDERSAGKTVVCASGGCSFGGKEGRASLLVRGLAMLCYVLLMEKIASLPSIEDPIATDTCQNSNRKLEAVAPLGPLSLSGVSFCSYTSDSFFLNL